MAEIVNPPSSGRPSSNGDEVYASRVGTTVKGKWTIDALLGVGGMAAVYAATHRNGQRAALKILHIDFAKDKSVCDRFLREAYVSNKIGHSACVAVLDDDTTEEGEPFLVMELLEGQTLRELWMNTGRRVPVSQVLKVADPILDCLDACHRIGVIHRDLKPANIFITKSGEVKVLDFGVAQFRSATAERTATGTALGTPSYMSPEQAMGLVDQLDGRADIFSVGAIIHALATGHRINKGRTENEALVMAATTPVPSVARTAPDLPVEVIALVDKALAWDRRNRFENAKQMQAAVRAALTTLGFAPRVEAAAPPQDVPLASGPRIPVAAPAHTPRAPAVAPATAPAPPPVQADAAPDDPRVLELRDLFKRIDRVLPSVRQLGWEHPATERATRSAFEGIAASLATNPALFAVSIRPHSFLFLNQTVWEPGPPFDAVPYNLFASGIRTLRLEQGLALDELRDALALMLLEPGRDLPPEDDLAAAFWEKGLPHVKYEVVDAFADGDAAEREAFFDESDRLEKVAEDASRLHVSRLEAKAMAISLDRGALGEKKAKTTPMSLDDVVRAVYASQLAQPSEKWSERYVDVLVDALIDAAKSRDAQPVLASLRRSAADLVVAGRVDVVTQLHKALLERLGERLPATPARQLSGALTNALFGAETFELMLRRVQAEPHRVPALEPVLEALGEHELPAVLSALKQPLEAPLVDALLRYVARVGRGHEAEIATVALAVDASVASGLLALLARDGSPAARQAIGALAQSPDPNVKIEAKVLLAGNVDAVAPELGGMLESESAIARMAALKAGTRYSVKALWPAIARHVKAPTLHELGSDERADLMRALLVLSPERGEPIALELAKKGGVFSSGEKEASRLSAIEALGACSRSHAVATALRELAQARWGTSDDVRAAAGAAADLVTQRMGEPS